MEDAAQLMALLQMLQGGGLPGLDAGAAEFLLQQQQAIHGHRAHQPQPPTVEQPINLAIKDGNADELVRLLADGADVETRSTTNNMTPLILACWEQKVECVNILLANGADKAAKANDGITALHAAGTEQIVKILIDANARIDEPNALKMSPLGWNCGPHGGSVPIAQLLIDAKADLAVKDVNGDTALTSSCFWGHTPLVRVLLDAKADINLPEGNGWSPLYSAVGSLRIETVRVLLEARADVNQAAPRRIKGLLPGGQTPLHVSCMKNGGADPAAYQMTARKVRELRAGGKFVIALLEHGADVNATDTTGDTALNNAANEGDVEMARPLLRWGAKMDISAPSPSGRSLNALTRARSHGTDSAIYKLLLTYERLRRFRKIANGVGALMALYSRARARVNAPGGAGYASARDEFVSAVIASSK